MLDWRTVLKSTGEESAPRPNKEKSQERYAKADFFPFFPCPSRWGSDVDIWQEFHNERIAMAIEGNLSVAQATQQALRECINHWLAQTPDHHADPDTCPHCNEPSGIISDIPSTSYANPGGWRLWIHDACMPAWCEHRRQAAVTALAGMGIGGMKDSICHESR
jgi:hypothetical protein